MLAIAQRREIGVIDRPIDPVAERREEADQEKGEPEPVDACEKRVLKRAQHGSGDDERPHAEARREGEHDRPQDKAAGQDERQRAEDGRNRDTRFEQIGDEEPAATRLRDRMNAVMKIEQIDGVIAEISHARIKNLERLRPH